MRLRRLGRRHGWPGPSRRRSPPVQRPGLLSPRIGVCWRAGRLQASRAPSALFRTLPGRETIFAVAWEVLRGFRLRGSPAGTPQGFLLYELVRELRLGRELDHLPALLQVVGAGGAAVEEAL